MLNETTYMVLLVKWTLNLFISEVLLVKVQIKPIEKIEGACWVFRVGFLKILESESGVGFKKVGSLSQFF